MNDTETKYSNAYMIHRIGTPLKAWRGHYSEWASEYWNNEDGWGHPSTGDVFTAEQRETLDLPMDGEWVEIIVGLVTTDNNKVR